jgi:hypothetical protein
MRECRIWIPSSDEVVGPRQFADNRWLETVKFAYDSRLRRIEESAFAGSGLKSISIPSSVVVLGESSFCRCARLQRVKFKNGLNGDSRLERIGASCHWSCSDSRVSLVNLLSASRLLFVRFLFLARVIGSGIRPFL